MQKFAKRAMMSRHAKTFLAFLACYGLIWLWVDLFRTTHFYLPFLLMSALFFLGIDVKLERRLKQKPLPMRRRTDLYAIPIVIGTFVSILTWGLRDETWGLLALPIALAISYVLFAALRTRYVRIKRMIEN